MPPDGAGELGGVGGYKDFAPDGAANRRTASPMSDSITKFGHKCRKDFASTSCEFGKGSRGIIEKFNCRHEIRCQHRVCLTATVFH